MVASYRLDDIQVPLRYGPARTIGRLRLIALCLPLQTFDSIV